MQIEKINKNQLEVLINIEDLIENKINLECFMASRIENSDLFFKILHIAQKKVRFNTKNYTIAVESFFVPLKRSFVLIITRIAPEKKLITASTRFTKFKLSFSVLCGFENFENFCMLCNFISNNIKLKSSLFVLDNTYYLYIKFNRLKDIKHTISSLYEFTNSISFNHTVDENAQLIVKDSAFETSKKYFT